MLLWSRCGKPVIICQGIIFQGTTEAEGARDIGNERSGLLNPWQKVLIQTQLFDVFMDISFCPFN